MINYDPTYDIEVYMPSINQRMSEKDIPINKRLIRACCCFINEVIADKFDDEELKYFRDDVDLGRKIAMLIFDWYYDNYGELAKMPNEKYYSGIITLHNHPLRVNIPDKTIIAIEDRKIYFFSRQLQSTESLSDMVQSDLQIDKLKKHQDNMLSDFSEVVKMSRSINLNIKEIDKEDKDNVHMAQGIWSHFEKAILDILSLKNPQVSIACWELHLAIEKALKVYVKQLTNKKETGHNLNDFVKIVKVYDPDLDFSLIKSLPSDKENIKRRYSESITGVSDVVNHYKNTLELVFNITNKYKRSDFFENRIFSLQDAPWNK